MSSQRMTVFIGGVSCGARGLTPQILQHQRIFAVDKTEDRRVQRTRICAVIVVVSHIIIIISLFTIGPKAGQL